VTGVGPVPSGWASVNVSPGGPGTNPNWQVRNDSAVFPAFSGTTYAFANFNSSTGANDIRNYMMSPLLLLVNGDTISFYTRTVGVPTFPDRLEVVINTTGSTLPADFTNVLLTINPTLTTAGYPSVWTQFTATVSGIPGGASQGRFAFHYNPTAGGPAGANSDYIGVDEVVYSGIGGNTPASNTTLGTGCGPAPLITLAASTLPITGTSWNLAVTNGALLNLIIIGASDPNIADLAFIGAPGCGLRASLDVVSVGSTFTLPIPNAIGLLGVSLFANGASVSPFNPLGFITSNGIQGTIGDI
jgi:hypothetical protein